MGNSQCCQVKNTVNAEIKCSNKRQQITSVKYIKAIKPESMVWYDEIMVNYEELKELERQQSTALQNRSPQIEEQENSFEDWNNEQDQAILSPKLVEIHQNIYLNQTEAIVKSQAYFPSIEEEENASKQEFSQSVNNANEKDKSRLHASTTVQFVIDCFTVNNIEEKSFDHLRKDYDINSMLRSKSKEKPRKQNTSVSNERKLSQFMSKYQKKKLDSNTKKREKQYNSNQTSLF